MLTNKILGCTCRMRNVCHGDVLIQLYIEKAIIDAQEERKAAYLQAETQPMEIEDETMPPFTWADVAKQGMMAAAMESMDING